MDSPATSKADFAPQLNHALAVRWLILAVPAKKLAVFWLLIRNSQPRAMLLNHNGNSTCKTRHNSQRKNISLETARNSQPRLSPARRRPQLL
jgi:hypothetical protein